MPGGDFWRLALAVCQAIDGTGEWPETSTVPQPPTGENKLQDCLNAELEAMLRRALEWSGAHPGATPRIAYPDDSSHSPCQDRIYALEIIDDSAQDEVHVALTAPGMSSRPPVLVDGQPVEYSDGDDDPGTGLRTVVFPVPRTERPRTIEVTVRSDFGLKLTGALDVPGAGVPDAAP
jgi:hypothetical protein